MMEKSVRQELIRSKSPGVCMLWYCETYLSIPWLDMKEKNAPYVVTQRSRDIPLSYLDLVSL